MLVCVDLRNIMNLNAITLEDLRNKYMIPDYKKNYVIIPNPEYDEIKKQQIAGPIRTKLFVCPFVCKAIAEDFKECNNFKISDVLAYDAIIEVLE